jgi:hypothetical protein
VNWNTGVVTDESGLMQKYYLPGELTRLLNAHRFRVVRMERIEYPWRTANAHGWGFFPGRPRIWDWYIEAQRD